jgi:CHAD domain-containing protein
VPHVEEGDVEALHRLRVASRRLRELVPLLALDPDTARRLNRRLRKVTRRLGSVRELDVLMLLIEELQGNTRYPQEGLKRVGAAVLRARTAARERLADKLPSGKLERIGRKLENAGKRLESRHGKSGPRVRANRPKDTWRWALDARLVRRAERARSAIEAAGAAYLPEPLHAVRIAFKKLRYTAELRSLTKRDSTAADIAAMKSVQDVLGRLHDLEVLISWTREAQASLFPPDLATWRELAALVRALDEDCRVLHARYMHDRARLMAIADRLRATKVQTPHGQRAAS